MHKELSKISKSLEQKVRNSRVDEYRQFLVNFIFNTPYYPTLSHISNIPNYLKEVYNTFVTDDDDMNYYYGSNYIPKKSFVIGSYSDFPVFETSNTSSKSFSFNKYSKYSEIDKFKDILSFSNEGNYFSSYNPSKGIFCNAYFDILKFKNEVGMYNNKIKEKYKDENNKINEFHLIKFAELIKDTPENIFKHLNSNDYNGDYKIWFYSLTTLQDLLLFYSYEYDNNFLNYKDVIYKAFPNVVIDSRDDYSAIYDISTEEKEFIPEVSGIVKSLDERDLIESKLWRRLCKIFPPVKEKEIYKKIIRFFIDMTIDYKLGHSFKKNDGSTSIRKLFELKNIHGERHYSFYNKPYGSYYSPVKYGNKMVCPSGVGTSCNVSYGTGIYNDSIKHSYFLSIIANGPGKKESYITKYSKDEQKEWTSLGYKNLYMDSAMYLIFWKIMLGRIKANELTESDVIKISSDDEFQNFINNKKEIKKRLLIGISEISNVPLKVMIRDYTGVPIFCFIDTSFFFNLSEKDLEQTGSKYLKNNIKNFFSGLKYILAINISDKYSFNNALTLDKDISRMNKDIEKCYTSKAKRIASINMNKKLNNISKFERLKNAYKVINNLIMVMDLIQNENINDIKYDKKYNFDKAINYINRIKNDFINFEKGKCFDFLIKSIENINDNLTFPKSINYYEYTLKEIINNLIYINDKYKEKYSKFKI